MRQKECRSTVQFFFNPFTDLRLLCYPLTWFIFPAISATLIISSWVANSLRVFIATDTWLLACLSISTSWADCNAQSVSATRYCKLLLLLYQCLRPTKYIGDRQTHTLNTYYIVVHAYIISLRHYHWQTTCAQTYVLTHRVELLYV